MGQTNGRTHGRTHARAANDNTPAGYIALGVKMRKMETRDHNGEVQYKQNAIVAAVTMAPFYTFLGFNRILNILQCPSVGWSVGRSVPLHNFLTIVCIWPKFHTKLENNKGS